MTGSVRTTVRNPAMMGAIDENARLSRWAALLPRGPHQRAHVHEADAELVVLEDGNVLAVTVDQVTEEVEIGLYSDLETVGRIAATAALSDLAAVGAAPLGLLLAVTLPADSPDEAQSNMARGVRDVVDRARTYVLGGDTSEGERAAMACTAVGLVRASEVMLRVGAKPGDLVYASGLLGLGAAFAAVALLGVPAPRTLPREFEVPGTPESTPGASAFGFKPPLRLREGRSLRGVASACIDTSDGALAALDQLARLNGVAIALDGDPADLLHPAARDVAARLGVSAVPVLAVHHGEFELVFTAPARKLEGWLAQAHIAGYSPVRIGRVLEGAGVTVGSHELDTAAIRNLSARAARDVRGYWAELEALCG